MINLSITEVNGIRFSMLQYFLFIFLNLAHKVLE